jgi:hypothetical protein
LKGLDILRDPRFETKPKPVVIDPLAKWDDLWAKVVGWFK